VKLSPEFSPIPKEDDSIFYAQMGFIEATLTLLETLAEPNEISQVIYANLGTPFPKTKLHPIVHFLQKYSPLRTEGFMIIIHDATLYLVTEGKILNRPLDKFPNFLAWFEETNDPSYISQENLFNAYIGEEND
jgi:hypothetical protein